MPRSFSLASSLLPLPCFLKWNFHPERRTTCGTDFGFQMWPYCDNHPYQGIFRSVLAFLYKGLSHCGQKWYGINATGPFAHSLDHSLLWKIGFFPWNKRVISIQFWPIVRPSVGQWRVFFQIRENARHWLLSLIRGGEGEMRGQLGGGRGWWRRGTHLTFGVTKLVLILICSRRNQAENASRNWYCQIYSFD